MDRSTASLFAPTPVATSPALPLRFVAPPGWPEPSPDWQAGHQGWVPPAGWTPLADLAPAPRTWVWWRECPAPWAAEVRRHRTEVMQSLVLAAILFAAGLLTYQLAPVGTAWKAVAWGLMAYGPIELARGIAALLSPQKRLRRSVAERYLRVGEQLDERAYAEHLAGPAGRGIEAPGVRLGRDAFLARRAEQSWTFDGVWDADQTHELTRADFGMGRSAARIRQRMTTVVLAGIAGVGLIVVLGWSSEPF